MCALGSGVKKHRNRFCRARDLAKHYCGRQSFPLDNNLFPTIILASIYCDIITQFVTYRFAIIRSLYRILWWPAGLSRGGATTSEDHCWPSLAAAGGEEPVSPGGGWSHGLITRWILKGYPTAGAQHSDKVGRSCWWAPWTNRGSTFSPICICFGGLWGSCNDWQ